MQPFPHNVTSISVRKLQSMQLIKVPNYPSSSSLHHSASPSTPHFRILALRGGWGKRLPPSPHFCSPWPNLDSPLSTGISQTDWDIVISEWALGWYQLFPIRHNVLFNRLLCFTLTVIFHPAWQNFKAKNPALHSKQTKLDSKLPFVILIY